jgi:hypothetical protein
VAALDNCSEYCDGDCVMDSNGIGYEEAQLRAQGAVALNEALLRAARQLPESKVFAQVPTYLRPSPTSPNVSASGALKAGRRSMTTNTAPGIGAGGCLLRESRRQPAQ